MWRNFTSEQTQKASFDFLPALRLLASAASRASALACASLAPGGVYLQLLSALFFHQTVLANFLTLVGNGVGGSGGRGGGGPWLWI